MLIKNEVRFRPFTHLPGMKMVVPFTQSGIQIFPTAVKILPENRLITFNLHGPVKHFTSTLDLEKGAILVSGHAENGYFRYWIYGSQGQVLLAQDKGPQGYMSIDTMKPPGVQHSLERLSLGVNKIADWDLVKRRGNLAEILPFWYRLGQMVEYVSISNQDCLATELKTALQAQDRERVLSLLAALCRVGFSDVLFPEAQDLLHLGYAKSPLPSNCQAFSLLSEGYHWIKSLLISVQDETLFFTPFMPSLFTYGKATSLKLPFGHVDLEWTKHKLRRINLFCNESSVRKIRVPKHLKRCRLRALNKSSCLDLSSQPYLDLSANVNYLFDNFE